LWSAVRVRRSHDGDADVFAERVRCAGTPESELLRLLEVPRAPPGPVSCAGAAPAAAQVDELQRLLLADGAPAALAFAMQQGLWPFALVLAHGIGGDEFQRAADAFIGRSLPPSPLAGVLRVLAGVRAEVTADSWRDLLATNVRHYTARAPQNLADIADFLTRSGNIRAAHVCRLLAFQPPQPPPGDFTLIGTDWEHPTIASIQMAQLASKAPPGLFAYALFYTLALADFGFLDKAAENAERVVERIRTEKLEQLAHVALIIKKRIARAMGRRADDGLLKSAMLHFHQAVTGWVNGAETEEQRAILPSSVSLEPVEAGEKEKSPVKMLIPQAPQTETAEPIKEQSKPGWIGGLLTKFNPFRKGTVVELEQHEQVELVWSTKQGKYVEKGHENDDPEPAAVLPPPPAARPAMPPPAAQSGRPRGAAGRYVSTF
jgi:hypothetical protein